MSNDIDPRDFHQRLHQFKIKHEKEKDWIYVGDCEDMD